jgi:hypothetical protein
MGDDQIQGLTAYVNNPMWKCSTCVPGQLSATVLAQVPEVIALHPDMVVILTGAYDLKVAFTDRDPELADNVLKMLAMFESANIPTVICLIPQLDYTDSYYFNEGMVQLNDHPYQIRCLISFLGLRWGCPKAMSSPRPIWPL